MVSNGEDVLAAGEPRQPEEEKRIRTMQEDLARASEHALPDLDLPPPSEELPPPPPAFATPFAPEPAPPPPPPPPPLPPIPPPPSSHPSEPIIPQIPPPPPLGASFGAGQAPQGLPVVEEEIDLLGDTGQAPPLPPSFPVPPPPLPPPPPAPEVIPSAFDASSALSPEERLSYGAEQEGAPIIEAPPVPSAAGGEVPVLRPEELLSFGEEALPEAKRSSFAAIGEKLPLKYLLLGGGGIVAVAAAGAAYFLFFKQPPTPPTPTRPTGTITPTSITPSCPEPTIPEALLVVSDTKIFTVDSLGQLQTEAEVALASSIPPGQLVRAVMDLKATADCRLLSFQEVLQGFRITLPPNVLESLDTSRFTVLLRREDGGMRAGFVVATKNADVLRGDLAAWEPNMAQDLDAFMRLLGKTTGPASNTFRDTTYRGLTVRFLNFPLPELTLDYAVDPQRNLLIFMTSRASMFGAIDALP